MQNIALKNAMRKIKNENKANYALPVINYLYLIESYKNIVQLDAETALQQDANCRAYCAKSQYLYPDAN